MSSGLKVDDLGLKGCDLGLVLFAVCSQQEEVSLKNLVLHVVSLTYGFGSSGLVFRVLNHVKSFSFTILGCQYAVLYVRFLILIIQAPILEVCQGFLGSLQPVRPTRCDLRQPFA